MLRFLQNNGENLDYEAYNLFIQGTMMGTTGFKMDYNADSSGFSFSHLHEPRRIPTNDRRGNQMDNPSAECVYSKRIYNPFSFSSTELFFDYFAGMGGAQKQSAYENPQRSNTKIFRCPGI